MNEKLGVIPWYTYFSKDTAKGKEFYKNLFSWNISNAPGEEDKHFFSVGKTGFADLEVEKTIPSHWATYVVVADVDKTCERVKKMGGKVLKPTFEMDHVGHMAKIEDPAGGKIWAYTPDDFSKMEWVMGPNLGQVCWHELMVPDPDKVKPFYSEIFGWKMEWDPKYNMSFLKVGEKTFGHLFKSPPGTEKMPPTWFLYFLTPTLQKTADQAVKLGAKIHVPKTDIPEVGSFVFLEDPTGALFYLWQPAQMKS